MDFNIFRSRKTAVHNQEQSSVHHVSNPVISSEIIVAEPKVETTPHDNFTCMYCLDKDQYRQFIFGIVGKTLADKRYRDAVPYLPDWPSFKRHMLTLHPEQWGYYLLEGESGPLSRKTWTKSDIVKASEGYIQIRARLEYGWNFFIEANGDLRKTLHSLPKDEAAITSVVWHPRATPNGLTWNDWRYEREGETHTRAQNLVPSIVRRSMASVTQILRGVRPTVTIGHTLEVHPTRFAKYAHLPDFVNKQCIFTDKALQRVLEVREEHNLPGAGNIGILLHDKSLLQGKPLEAKGQEELVVQKEEIHEEPKSDETVVLDDLWDTINTFMPSNDYTIKLMVQLHDVFEFAKAEAATAETNEDWKAKYEEEHALVAGLRSDVAEAVADSATKTEQLNAQIASLQSQLESRGRNKSASEIKKEMDKATQKTLQSIKNEPHAPRRRRYI